MNRLPSGSAVLIETQLGDGLEPWVRDDEGAWRRRGPAGPEGRPLSDGARDEAEIRERVHVMLGNGAHVCVLRGIKAYPMSECWGLRLMIVESDLHEEGDEVWLVADEHHRLVKALVPPREKGPKYTPAETERRMARRLGDIAWVRVRALHVFEARAIARDIYRGLLEERLNAGDKRAEQLAQLVPA